MTTTPSFRTGSVVCCGHPIFETVRYRIVLISHDLPCIPRKGCRCLVRVSWFSYLSLN